MIIILIFVRSVEINYKSTIEEIKGENNMIQDAWISACYYVITLMIEDVGRLFVEEVEWENGPCGITVTDYYTTADGSLYDAYVFYSKEMALNACDDINKTVENEKEKYVVWRIEEKTTYEEIE